MRVNKSLVKLGSLLSLLGATCCASAVELPTTDLGDRLEVLWDMDRITALDNAYLTLHPPKLREISIVHDAPWEGNVCCYHTVFQDGALYRMYYRGAAYKMPGQSHPEFTCYAESDDGIVWRKPELGLIDFQ